VPKAPLRRTIHLKAANFRRNDFAEMKKAGHQTGLFEFGASRATRTPDPLVRSQVLYPTELWMLRRGEIITAFEDICKSFFANYF
jgi:hypothetical protein